MTKWKHSVKRNEGYLSELSDAAFTGVVVDVSPSLNSGFQSRLFIPVRFYAFPKSFSPFSAR